MAGNKDCNEDDLNHRSHESPYEHDFYASFARRLSPSSRSTMRYALQEVVRMLGDANSALSDFPWEKIRREDAESLVHTMFNEGYAGKTCECYLGALRGILTEAHRHSCYEVNDLLAICAVKSFDRLTPSHKGFVKREVVNDLLANCEMDHRYQGARDAAIICLIYECGLGRGQCVDAEICDLNQQEWCLSVRSVSGKEMIKWLSPAAILRIETWLQIRNRFLPSSGPLFNRIRKGTKNAGAVESVDTPMFGTAPGIIVEDRLDKCSIAYIIKERSKAINTLVTPRDLRSSFITNKINTAGLRMAQRLADHECISTTFLYQDSTKSL